MSKDPRTGKFRKGNPGRPRGTKNVRTVQWEELGKELTDRHADKFNALLDRLWASRDLNDQVRAAELFLRLAEYFRPKLQRTQHYTDTSGSLPRIIIRVKGSPVEDGAAPST